MDLDNVPGYEGYYQVTPCGKVWSVRSELWMKQAENDRGYLRVHFRKEGVHHHYYVHRLVAVTHLEPPLDWKLLQVRHMDDDNQNNDVSNLRWGTNDMNYEDREHHRRIRTILTVQQEVKIIEDIERGYSVTAIAEGHSVPIHIIQEMHERCLETDWYF